VVKKFYSAKKVSLQFLLYSVDISLKLFAACSLIFFPHLPFLRSDTNRRKVTSNVVEKENKAFCIISNDLFIFFPHSST
jgi:hypothetical protein